MTRLRPVARALNSLGLRARIMLLHGLLFLVAGAVLVSVTYAFTERAIGDRFFTQQPLMSVSKVIGPQVEQEGQEEALDRIGADKPIAFFRSDLVKKLEVSRQAILADVLRNSILLMVVVAAVGLLFGWAMTGRALRPLRQVTSAAERLSESTLHERIALCGPRDDVKRLADTFDAMLDRLQRAFDYQRRFVSNASHELRTPIAINRTLIEVALDEPGASADLRALGASLLSTNARHERLIEGLLLLARSQHELVTPRPVNLGEVVGAVLDQTRPAAERRRIRVTFSAVPVRASGDALLLERCVFNLVENGIKYNRKGGDLRLALSREGEEVVLGVDNDGVAIPPYEVEELFEPFRRLHDRIGSSSGSGLGLSIVRAIAAAHRGTVTATPRAGGGLSVEVRLPAA
ncbi:ATP-binding protein [Spongiactinospora sp. TRM90649]|uniref:sensor histidine kinase n=1 Tax=Spongiactinospora sp. TRM90649 TaxID=3031114 RepID=UPI0023F90FC7|nr:ATP-binding protein [Spongiactinospora sp. TRM90649]MDF5755418.1 ATP-binding protein [Spongiactinospora sp. TRM90649]